MHFRRKMAPFMAGCLLLGSIRLPNLTVQASQALGDAAAYTEEAEAQQPVEDDSTVLGIVRNRTWMRKALTSGLRTGLQEKAA